MTISEDLFEKLCMTRGIQFERIDPSSKSKTADYLIWINSTEVLVEVKQIDKSNHEYQLESGAENGDSPFIASDVVPRIRNKFDKAKKQLKGCSQARIPAIIVLFDNTSGLSGMNNEDFLKAMYGDEIVQFPIKISKLRFVNQKGTHYFGGQRKFGSLHNRSISGICRMLLDDKGVPYLIYFHNRDANIRLTPEEVKNLSIQQFERDSLKGNEYRDWTEVP